MSFKVVSSTTIKGSGRSSGRVAPTMLGDTNSMNSISNIRRTDLTWEIAYKSTRTFDPDSTKMQLWHTFLLVVVLYDAWIVPLLTCFGQLNPAICHASWLQVGVTAGEFFFLLDVYVQMHSRVYLFGNLIRDIKVIRRLYVASWGFPLDIVALLPLAAFLPASLDLCGLDLVNKLLRLRKVHAYTLKVDKVFARYYKLCKVVKAVVVVYFSCHVMACIYASFGKKGDPSTVDDAWKLYDSSTSAHHRRRLTASIQDGETKQLLTEYFASLFWAMGLVCKCVEGQIPRTLLQTVFMLAVMVTGFLLFVYICSTLFMISKCDANSTEVFDAKLNQLKYIMSFHQVPMDIQDRAIEYLKNGFKSGEANDRQTLKLLCPSIAQDIKYATLQSMVTSVPFFKYCRATFVRALIDLMETQSVPTNYILCRKGEVGQDMYFVQSGVMVVIVDNVKVRELRSGHYFGEQAIFINQIRSATVVASTFCMLQKLSRAHVRMVMQGYPECEGQILACVSTIAEEQRKVSMLIQQRSLSKSIGVGAVRADDSSASKVPTTKQDVVQRRMSKRFVGPIGDISDFQHDQLSTRTHSGLYRLLLKTPIPRKSTVRLVWLVAVMATTVYNIVVVPFINVFDLVGYPVSVFILNTLTDVVLWLDIYGKFNLTFVHEAEHVADTIKCANHYYESGFVVDLVSTFPLWIVCPSLHIPLRGFRLLRLLHLHAELEEMGLFVRIDSRKRIVLLGLGLVLCYHIAGCMAHSLTFALGYGDSNDGWLPPKTIRLVKIVDNSTGNLVGYDYMDGARFVSLSDPLVGECILRQYTRALQYGTVCLTDLGHILEPEALEEFVLALGLMLSGMLLISMLIDDVQKCVTASAVEQLQFMTLRSRMMQFFNKEKIPHKIRRRVSEYMDFRWSAHRGANMNTLLGELPTTIRRDIYGLICAPFLDVIELFDNIAPHFDRICELILDNLVVNLYTQGELVYNKGEYADALYVLVAGDVMVVSNTAAQTALPLRYVKIGEIFGCSSLVLDGECTVHADNAVARAACVVALISRDTLKAAAAEYSNFCQGLLKREQKLLAEHRAMTRLLDQAELAAMSQRKPRGILDPDSLFVIAWDTLLFFVLATQVVAIPFFLAFGYATVGATSRIMYSVIVEVVFALDMVLKTRTGYYSFGNKVSDAAKIRYNYFHSAEFVWNVVAILPVDIVAPGFETHHSEVWRLHKLVRLFTLPGQIEKLEHYFFTHSIPIRVLKVVFFVYLLAHYVGCAWYGFASFGCTIWGDDDCPFGKDAWLPSQDIALNHPGVSTTVKYTRAFYWGLGLLLGFNKGDVPATPWEAVFTIVVQTVGVFLLAYVVGNLLDVAQIMDGNNQLFYSNLTYVRKLTRYFDFTDDVRTKIQHFYFYRLAHSIHEEHVLTSSLPPNLVGDIRLFLLTPMLRKVPFFHDEIDSDSHVARLLVRHLAQLLVTRHEIVCRQHDVGIDMYFVFVGCLNVLVAQVDKDMSAVRHSSITFETSQFGTKVNELHAGSFFGERALFSDQPRTATIQAKTFCTLYKLSRTHLESVFVHYPAWKAKVIQVVQEYYRIRQIHVESVEPKSPSAQPRGDVDAALYRPIPVEGTCFRHITQTIASSWTCRFVSPNQVLENVVKAVTQIEVQSPFYRGFLHLVRCTLLYVAVREPYMVAFGAAITPTVATAAVSGLDTAATVVCVLDLWFKCHIVETPESFEFYDRIPRPSRIGLVLDVLVVLPFDHIFATVVVNQGAPLRLLRLLKLRQLNHVYRELERFSMSHELNKIKLLALYYFIICYWTACAYYGLACTVGFSNVWESSLPVVDFESTGVSGGFDALFTMHQFARCMYYSLCMYTGVGMVYEPTAQLQYAFNCIVHVFGIFVMGYVIGEGSTLCIYLIQNEVDFKINQMHVMEYLGRKHLTRQLHVRIHNYLSYWWSFQQGVNYQAVLEQLPPRIRGHAVFEISRRSLSRFSVRYIRPAVQQCGIDLIIHKLVRRLVFQGYPAGETVLIQGNIGHTMFFVSSGTVMTVSTAPNFKPSRFEEGQFFGDEGLMASAVRQYSAVTLRACDLLALTAEDFLAAMNESPRTAECCRVAQSVAKSQKSLKHRLAQQKGSFGRMICDSMTHMAPTLRSLKPMTPEVAEIVLGQFVKLFLPSPPPNDDLGTCVADATTICHHCESIASAVYCRLCQQALCDKCSSLMHDASHLSFHLPSIARLRGAVEKSPPATLLAPRLRRFVSSMVFRRRTKTRFHDRSTTGLDNSSSVLSVTRLSMSTPMPSQPENDTLNDKLSRRGKFGIHVKRLGASTSFHDGSSGPPVSKLTHTNSEASLFGTIHSQSTRGGRGQVDRMQFRDASVETAENAPHTTLEPSHRRTHSNGLKVSHSSPKIQFRTTDNRRNASGGNDDIPNDSTEPFPPGDVDLSMDTSTRRDFNGVSTKLSKLEEAIDATMSVAAADSRNSFTSTRGGKPTKVSTLDHDGN
ncbi:hypothetical protein H310_00153 [Aphanomyces invadans]|uniref:Cyclic nucleotide-binding domain-containing protein n=1 Tax=Aphanomyces invadans TaxID=157072 RepID=A0A024USW8_9STRA|nr:hypothetical protein H310_00153 [Aphanomyces invadans]ETW09621.1 hypothetical protein H310_00153 [Aphanomyces invadans]|eukprot:XP_008861032.1 hypothetical protein H310_00153 [Aphanomyces invadans]